MIPYFLWKWNVYYTYYTILYYTLYRKHPNLLMEETEITQQTFGLQNISGWQHQIICKLILFMLYFNKDFDPMCCEWTGQAKLWPSLLLNKCQQEALKIRRGTVNISRYGLGVILGNTVCLKILQLHLIFVEIIVIIKIESHP